MMHSLTERVEARCRISSIPKGGGRRYTGRGGSARLERSLEKGGGAEVEGPAPTGCVGTEGPDVDGGAPSEGAGAEGPDVDGGVVAEVIIRASISGSALLPMQQQR